MTEAEQRTAVATNAITPRKPDGNISKDAQYWEKKVADAMRKVSQRLAAG